MNGELQAEDHRHHNHQPQLSHPARQLQTMAQQQQHLHSSHRHLAFTKSFSKDSLLQNEPDFRATRHQLLNNSNGNNHNNNNNSSSNSNTNSSSNTTGALRYSNARTLTMTSLSKVAAIPAFTSVHSTKGLVPLSRTTFTDSSEQRASPSTKEPTINTPGIGASSAGSSTVFFPSLNNSSPSTSTITAATATLGSLSKTLTKIHHSASKSSINGSSSSSGKTGSSNIFHQIPSVNNSNNMNANSNNPLKSATSLHFRSTSMNPSSSHQQFRIQTSQQGRPKHSPPHQTTMTSIPDLQGQDFQQQQRNQQPGGRIMAMLRQPTRTVTMAPTSSTAITMASTLQNWSPHRLPQRIGTATTTASKSYQSQVSPTRNNEFPAQDATVESSSHIKMLSYQTSYSQLPPSFVNQVNQMKRINSKSPQSDPGSSTNIPAPSQSRLKHQSTIFHNFEQESDEIEDLGDFQDTYPPNSICSLRFPDSSSTNANTKDKHSVSRGQTNDFHPQTSSLAHGSTVASSTVSRFGSQKLIPISHDAASNVSNSFDIGTSGTLPNASSVQSNQDSNINSNGKKKTVQFKFEQTSEQQRFQNDFMQRIRTKLQRQQTRGGGYQSAFSLLNQDEEFTSAVAAVTSSANSTTMTTVPTETNAYSPILSEEISHTDPSAAASAAVNSENKFKEQLPQPGQKTVDVPATGKIMRKVIQNELNNRASSISRSFHFFLADVDITLFLNAMEFMYTSALTAAIAKNTSNMPFKKYFLKYPQTLFLKITDLLTSQVLREHLSNSIDYLTLCNFETLALAQYEQLNFKPKDNLEQLGGKKRCESFILDFQSILVDALSIQQNKIPDAQLIELGIALITSNYELIDGFMNTLKRQHSISDQDLSLTKYQLYKYLFIDKDGIFDESTKLEFMKKFEYIRFKYFMPCATIETDGISRELVKNLQTKKPLLDYFQDENQIHKVTLFIFQMMDCLFYNTDPASITYWLKRNTKKPVDESFFLQFKPLFMEILKMNKLRADFIQTVELKFFWLKLSCGILAFDSANILNRMDELISNMNRWIDGMVTSKQLSKAQLAKIDQIIDTSFLQYFIKSVFNEDCFYPGETVHVVEAFGTSIDSVQFQLKGLKRIFLLMRFKSNVAYEIAELIIKIFNQSIYSFNA